MLRTITIFTLIVLLTPFALAAVEEQVRVTNLETLNWEIYGYDTAENTWKYKNLRFWWSDVSVQSHWIRGDQIYPEHKYVATMLTGKTKQEGYQFLASLGSVWRVNMPQEAQSYINESETTNQETDLQPREIQEENTITQETGCGINFNQGYIKLCYNDKRLFSYDPQYDRESIKQFVDESIRANRVGDGFIVVVHPPEDSAASREKRIREITTSIVATNRGSSAYVISGITQATNEQNVVYVLTEYGLQNSQHPEVQAIQNTLSVSSNQVLREAYRQGFGVAWATSWQSSSQEIQEENENLRNRLQEKTGIPIFITGNQELWDTSTTEKIHDQLQQAYDQTHPKGCAAYILYDREKVEVYQNKNTCRINYRYQDIYRQTTSEQIRQILTSAIANSPRADPERLMLSAYQLVTQATFDSANQQADDISLWIVRELEGENQESQASRQIILARTDINKNNFEDALDKLDVQTIQRAYPRMQPLGAQTALEALKQQGDCQELARGVEIYAEMLNSNALRSTYNTELRRCNEQELQKQCSIEKEASERTRLAITLVNDGMQPEAFEDNSQRLLQSLLRTTNLNAYDNHISVYSTKTQTQISRSSGYLQPPQINHQTAAQLQTGCPADMFIVLSDEEYYPTTVGNDAYISASACNYQTQCLSIYAARSLAMGLFGLQAEPQTVTAPRAQNPAQSTLEDRFSQQQQEQITRWFGGMP